FHVTAVQTCALPIFAGRDGEIALSAAPFLLAGCVVLFASGGALNTLGLGEDAARSIGMNTVLVRLFFGFAVILAAGASVASAGRVGRAAGRVRWVRA